VSDTAELLRAAAALSWVVVAIVVVFIMRNLIATGRVSELGVGPVTVKLAEAKIDEAISKAPERASAAVGNAAKRKIIDRLQRSASLLARARILWADDHPEYNQPLIELLRDYGATVDTPKSNREALALLEGARYDVIISDVARDKEEGNRELKGLELAETVFKRWGLKSLLFTLRFDPATYPGASDQERLELVSRVHKSVFARTNRTDEALHYILDVLERHSPPVRAYDDGRPHGGLGYFFTRLMGGKSRESTRA